MDLCATALTTQIFSWNTPEIASNQKWENQIAPQSVLQMQMFTFWSKGLQLERGCLQGKAKRIILACCVKEIASTSNVLRSMRLHGCSALGLGTEHAFAWQWQKQQHRQGKLVMSNQHYRRTSNIRPVNLHFVAWKLLCTAASIFGVVRHLWSLSWTCENGVSKKKNTERHQCMRHSTDLPLTKILPLSWFVRARQSRRCPWCPCATMATSARFLSGIVLLSSWDEWYSMSCQWFLESRWMQREKMQQLPIPARAQFKHSVPVGSRRPGWASAPKRFDGVFFSANENSRTAGIMACLHTNAKTSTRVPLVGMEDTGINKELRLLAARNPRSVSPLNVPSWFIFGLRTRSLSRSLLVFDLVGREKRE